MSSLYKPYSYIFPCVSASVKKIVYFIFTQRNSSRLGATPNKPLQPKWNLPACVCRNVENGFNKFLIKQCHGLTWQPATKHEAAACSLRSFFPSRMGRGNGQKGNLVGWDKDTLIKDHKGNTTATTTTNSQYAKQTIDFRIFLPPPNDQLCHQSSSSNPGTRNLWILQIWRNSQKDWTPGKVRTPPQKIRKKEKKRRRISAPWQTPVYKLGLTSMVWNISVGQLGLAARLCSLPAPAHLLVSWTWETRKSPWFLSNNWKQQCYQHSSHTKSKTQQLLGGKLTPSQLKPGQGEMKTHWWLNSRKKWESWLESHVHFLLTTQAKDLSRKLKNKIW